jgi:hypothetical protein
MNQPKYDIGQSVWAAATTSGPVRETCPDCLGERVWACVLPSGEALNVPCPTCAHGYDGSRGYIMDRYECSPRVWEGVVGSVRIDTNDREHPVSYMLHETGVGSGSISIYYEPKLFLSREEAEACATVEAEKQQARLIESNVMARSRRKHDRPGSLVAYLRSDIKRNERDIARTREHLARIMAAHPRMLAAPAESEGGKP